MKKSLFADNFPGTLLPIERGEFAFLPHPLPPDWSMPLELWPGLAAAKEQLARLDGTARFLKNPGLLLKPLQRREAIQSSRMEGTHATARELLLFELDPREPISATDQNNDRLEVYNYGQALQQAAAADVRLCVRTVKEMHRTMLSGVRGQDKRPGEFRNIQVAIGDDHRFVPPPPQHVANCFSEMEKYIHAPAETRKYDPLIDCFLVHYQFETIHPFVDGNGRVGRLLLSLMIQQYCHLAAPWLYLSEYFEAHRDRYIDHLFNVSAQGNWFAWLEFCVAGVRQQAESTMVRCKRLFELKEQFGQRAQGSGGSVRLQAIVERLFDSPVVDIAGTARVNQTHYLTAQKDIDRLIELRILRDVGDGRRPRLFFSPDIFDIAYRDLDASGGFEP